jgi:hypothetical protein
VSRIPASADRFLVFERGLRVEVFDAEPFDVALDGVSLVGRGMAASVPSVTR